MTVSVFRRRVLLPLFDAWGGVRFSLYEPEVRRIIQMDQASQEAYQLSRLRLLCQHAYNTTEFYRNRFQQVGITRFDRMTLEEFASVPPLTRHDMTHHREALISRDFPVSQLRASATGGTTAAPVKFYMDWNTYLRRLAADAVWDSQVGYERGQKIAFLWGAQQDLATHNTWRLWLKEEVLLRRKMYSANPLDPQVMDRIYHELSRWKPHAMQAYPSPLAIFGEHLLRRGWRLPLHVALVTAEACTATQRKTIQQAFGTDPIDFYGARDMGRIATECHAHQGLHINTYGVYVEVADQAQFGNSGVGRLLVTDLWNLGMPLLRCDLGDLGSLTQASCTCGSVTPRIAALEGRIADVFVNRKGQKVPGISFNGRIVNDNAEIRYMQVCQVAVGKFEFFIVPGKEWSEPDSIRKLQRKLEEFLEEPTEVTVSLVEELPKEPSGKVKFCKSLVASSSSSAEYAAAASS